MDKRYKTQWEENYVLSLLHKKKTKRGEKLLISEKITIFLAIWIIIVLFITGDGNIEIFLILIFIGLLIGKELTDRYTSVHLRRRMNMFIFFFLIIFITIIGEKIIKILNS